jgi:hypothetical protein
MGIVRGHHKIDDNFVTIPNAWIRDQRLSLKAKGLLAQILSHRPGWRITITRIARDNACGTQLVKTALDELLQYGYLERSAQRERDSNGFLTDYTYTTRDPEGVPIFVPSADNPGLDSPSVDKSKHKNTTSEKTTSLESLNEQAPDSERVMKLFEEFWKTYPRLTYRGRALTMWLKVVEGGEIEGVEFPPADPQMILDGARQFAADPHLPLPQFIPQPSNWLKAQGWLDGPLPERQKTPEELEKIAREKSARDRERRDIEYRKWQKQMAENEKDYQERVARGEVGPPKCKQDPTISILRCKHAECCE